MTDECDSGLAALLSNSSMMSNPYVADGVCGVIYNMSMNDQNIVRLMSAGVCEGKK